jgi:agmatine deiminase
MPAEWEPHAATWVAWPTSTSDWAGCLDRAQAEFAALVRALLESEVTHVLAPDPEAVRAALGPPAAHPRLRLHRVVTAEAFLRDTGPTFVATDGGGLVAIDWHFDAWGGRYEESRRDDAIAGVVAALAGVPALRVDLVAEGGALEVDGEGTLLASRGALLDPKRNPGATRAECERRLAALLGVSEVIWLDAVLEGDDTGGHVDTLARFVAPGRVVSVPDCRERLRRARDARGRALEVVDLPMPPPIEAEGRRLPASYANFYIADGAVLVPQFGAPTDREALALLGALLPGREAIGVPCRTLLRGLGTVHCLTQQQPVGTRRR